MSKKLQPGINEGFSNAEYHGDQAYLSSSSLKLLLESSARFYNDKILGLGKQLEGSFLDEGTLTHSLILEPHTIKNEFAFYNGMRKQGGEFEQFKADAGKKLIISKPQKMRCDQYFAAYKQRKEAVKLIQNGFPEHTICGKLVDINLKVRGDYVNIEQGYIVDVKTTGMPADLDSFKLTIQQYSYELSAALYLEVIEQFYGKKFEFYFLVIGKKDLRCEVYKLSDASRELGRNKVYTALSRYKECIKTGDWSGSQLVKSPVLVFEASSTYEVLEV